MSKHFLINPNVTSIGSENVSILEREQRERSGNIWQQREDQAEKAMHEDCPLKHIDGRVIVRIDMEKKNQTTFAGGLKIRRERAYNNFNFREVNPSNAIVISAENIPNNAEVLIDYTAVHDSNKIFSYKSLSPDVVYYSIKEEDCYAWRMPLEEIRKIKKEFQTGDLRYDTEWKPTLNCEFGLRIWKPYQGLIAGIEPTRVKDCLYVTTGTLKGNVAITLRGCDYCIVFQNSEGKEEQILRFRHSDKHNFKMEEVIGIAHNLTEQINKGELLVGLTASDAKTIL